MSARYCGVVFDQLWDSLIFLYLTTQSIGKFSEFNMTIMKSKIGDVMVAFELTQNKDQNTVSYLECIDQPI